MPLIKCRSCGKEISDMASSCSNCNEPQMAISAIPEPAVLVTEPRTDPLTVVGGIISVGLAIWLLWTFIAWRIDSKNEVPKPKDYSQMAFIQCKSFVAEHLKAPSTADFPFLDRETINMGDNTFIIKSYVDAQNSFGAKIRNKTFCKLKWNGGEETDIRNWKLIQLEMGE